MITVKCDSCGNSLHFENDATFVICEFCLTTTYSPFSSISALNLDILVRRGLLALLDEEWSEARKCFDEILTIDSEYAPAYIGRLCAKLYLKNDFNLPEHSGKPLATYEDFRNAMKYATGDYLKILEQYCTTQELNKGEVKKAVMVIAVAIVILIVMAVGSAVTSIN